MWHEKRVTLREVFFFNQFKGTDIVPEFTIEKNTDINTKKDLPYILKTKKYPYTWGEYQREGHDMTPYKVKFAKLVQRLHEYNICHGDMHGGNIVIDPETEDIRLIDFGGSWASSEALDETDFSEDYVIY